MQRRADEPDQFLADVRSGVWGELSAAKVTIDPYRRNLQRSYLDIANNKLNAPPAAAPAPRNKRCREPYLDDGRPTRSP